MGLMSQGIEKAHTRQRDAIVAEAAKVGTRVVNFGVVGDDPTTSGVLGSMAKVFVGGKVSIDDAQVFTFDSQGFQHSYMQPYDGMNPMPGWHFATLPGSVPQAAILAAKSLGRTGWFDRNDATVDGLNTHPAMVGVIGGLKWKWKLGTTEIKLPWTLQMRPTGTGTTEVAMRAGRYEGIMTCGVGVQMFLFVCSAVHMLTSPALVEGEPFIASIGL
jgi:hypothetical protein